MKKYSVLRQLVWGLSAVVIAFIIFILLAFSLLYVIAIINPHPHSTTAYTDGRIKSRLANIRAQGEIYYDAQTPRGYGPPFPAGTCPTAGGSMFTTPHIQESIQGALTLSGGGPEAARCAASEQSYAVSVQLKSDPKKAWCVDSTGETRMITNLEWAGISCPEG